MKYFVQGTAHFFNLFAEFLEHCENVIYFIFALMLIAIIIYSLKKVKLSLVDVFKSYIKLFKYVSFLVAFILLLISTILTYLSNNQFVVLSLLVAAVNFLKETFNIYDDKILHYNNLKIFKFKDFRDVLIPNLILIFFKTTYWAELYVFNLEDIKTYFVTMLIVISIQLFVMVAFRLYSIYTKVFFLVKCSNNYSTVKKLYDFIKILIISNNEINYFRLIKIEFQREKFTNEKRSDISSLCFYYKVIKRKLKLENTYESNLKIYKDFTLLEKRLGSENDVKN